VGNKEEDYYNSIRFYVKESHKLKLELKKHETEYFPEKVRNLIRAYKFTLIKIIKNCEGFLIEGSEDEDRLERVKITLVGYSDLLKSISRS